MRDLETSIRGTEIENGLGHVCGCKKVVAMCTVEDQDV